MGPLDAKRHIEPACAARYNGAPLQRERIVNRLRHGPATRGLLTTDCDCPSVTKRISELRRMGLDIRMQWIEETSAAGRVNVTALYSLAGDPDRAQLSLTLE